MNFQPLKTSVISILVPVFNEGESIETLIGEILEFGPQLGQDYEVIVVDDGSTDFSWNLISGLCQRHPQIIGIRFRRNFGKAAAIRCAADAAKGDILVTLDGDLQDDPKEIPKLLQAMDQGAGVGLDLVSGWKKVRHDPLHKTIPSRVFNWLVSWMTGVKLNDHNSGFKAYQRSIFDDVKLYGEMHRFVPVLAAARGYRVGEVAVNHRPRRFGRSKYGWSRLVKGFLDLLTVSFLTGYHQRPQHLLGLVGIVSFGCGLLGMAGMAVYWLIRVAFEMNWEPLHQRPIVLYSLGAMLLGSQLLCMGFLAELLVARDQARSTPYSVRDRINVLEQRQDHP